jgi:hypothetical protein
LVHLIVLQKMLVGRSAESRVPLAIWAWMAPAIAPAIALLTMKMGIIFRCDRNVTRIFGWQLYTRSDTAGIEIFIHRKNSISFHKRPPPFVFRLCCRRAMGCALVGFSFAKIAMDRRHVSRIANALV